MKVKSKKQVIFSTYYNEDYFNQCKRELCEELCVSEEDLDESRVWDTYNTNVESDREDFSSVLNELNVIADKKRNVCESFALIGTVQRWNGKREAAKELRLEKLLTSLGSDIENVEVYAENKRIYVQASHHDGTHYFELRQKRANVTVETFSNAMYARNTSAMNVTKSSYPLFAEYYGW